MSIDVNIGSLCEVELLHNVKENGTSCVLSDVDNPSVKYTCYEDDNGVFKYNLDDNVFNLRSRIKCTISSNSLSPIKLEAQFNEEVIVNSVRDEADSVDGIMKDEVASSRGKIGKINSVDPVTSESFDWINSAYDVVLIGKNPPAVLKSKYEDGPKKKKQSKADLLEPIKYDSVHMTVKAVNGLSIAVVNNFGELTVDVYGNSKEMPTLVENEPAEVSESGFSGIGELMSVCKKRQSRINFGCFNGSKGIKSDTQAHDIDYLWFAGGQNSRCGYDEVGSYLNVSLSLKDSLIGYNSLNLHNGGFNHLFKVENLTSLFSTIQSVWQEICSVEQLQSNANSGSILRILNILNSAICYYNDGMQCDARLEREIRFNTLLRMRNEISVVLTQLLQKSYLNPENLSGDHDAQLMYDAAAKIRTILNNGILGTGKVLVHVVSESVLRSNLLEKFSTTPFQDSTKSDGQKLVDDFFVRSRELIGSFGDMLMYFTGNNDVDSSDAQMRQGNLSFSEHSFESGVCTENQIREQMLR